MNQKALRDAQNHEASRKLSRMHNEARNLAEFHGDSLLAAIAHLLDERARAYATSEEAGAPGFQRDR